MSRRDVKNCHSSNIVQLHIHSYAQGLIVNNRWYKREAICTSCEGNANVRKLKEWNVFRTTVTLNDKVVEGSNSKSEWKSSFSVCVRLSLSVYTFLFSSVFLSRLCLFFFWSSSLFLCFRHFDFLLSLFQFTVLISLIYCSVFFFLLVTLICLDWIKNLVWIFIISTFPHTFWRWRGGSTNKRENTDVLLWKKVKERETNKVRENEKQQQQTKKKKV